MTRCQFGRNQPDPSTNGWKLTATANYGTAAGVPVTRPSTIPASTDTILVNRTEYDASGRAVRWINPLALESRVEYDAQDRAIRNIQNATASNPADMLVTEQLYSPDC